MFRDSAINQLMLENLQILIYLCRNDASLTPLRLHGRIEELSGYRREGFLCGEIKIPDLYHPDDREMIVRAFREAEEKDQPFHITHRLRHRDGSWYWIESIGKVIADENDPSLSYVSGFLMDVSERKKIQDGYRKLSEIVRHSPASVVVTDKNGAIEYVNPKFEEVTGYSFEEALGKNPRILKSGRQSDDYYQELWDTILTGNEWRGEFSNRKKNGEIYWELASISPVLNENDEVESFVAVKEDITERKRSEDALTEAKTALEDQVLTLEKRNREIALFSEMQAALLNCGDEAEAYQILAEYAEKLFPNTMGSLYQVSGEGGLSRLVGWGEMCSQMPDFPFAARLGNTEHTDVPFTRPFLSDCYIGSVDTVTARQSLCIPLYTQGQLWGVFQLVLQPGDSVKQTQQLAVSVMQQYLLAVENLRLREELRMQAIRDPLTGLYNRRYLEAELAREISRAERKQDAVCVIMLDIDHFKNFNDQYGHDMGDIVLRHLGLFLQNSVRSGDVACRYGGEEFLIIMPEINLESAVERAETLRAGIEKFNENENRHYPGKLTISLGVAAYPQHGSTRHEVMVAADEALYAAKRAGRNQVKVFQSQV